MARKVKKFSSSVKLQPKESTIPKSKVPMMRMKLDDEACLLDTIVKVLKLLWEDNVEFWGFPH